MNKYFKNPFVWVIVAFVCFLFAWFMPVKWVSVLFAFLGIGFSLVAWKLLDNHEKNKNATRRKKKLSSFERSMYVSLIIVMAMCVSTLSSLIAPVCFIVALAVFIWYLYEKVQEYMKEAARAKTKRK